ncbi:Methionine aminopeptidase-like protein [Hapsidospora chrysogenum ATCC 11550]|uniref:Methionine aminopeptidase 2 n=1 Tax=Hapsidospora chrysogenum (strain ATCC 11550 / CBS 779.69 / DSM 880 / IAM 14645 / JCM 23072 / IMI 49137) TaxID=857340 RepID=A0A086T2K7_HAPC1|nr:Methionine aminopeptidase-like protein [Hapsidospora chrysogenum ATCC 11550]
MGSKTLDNEDDKGFGGSSNSSKADSVGGEPRGAHTARDGDGSLGDGGGDEGDSDGDDDEVVPVALTGLESCVKTTKKNKRKRTKRKKTKTVVKQSSPPRVPLNQVFPSGEYPSGELLNYRSPPDSSARATASELRYLGRRHLEDPALLNDYRKAAEVHRQVRQWVQETVKPGQTLTEIALGVEDGVRALLGNDGLAPGSALVSGMGFPTGLSLNHCVAHYTPNPGHKDIVLQQKDVLKVDFGVHVNGWIVDSAFTMSFDPTYDNLLAAVKDATDTGIKTAGIDVRICDVSAAIQEVMESYEVEIDGKVYPVKAVRSICAHDIKRYRIHGEKQIPFVKTSDQTKMEEGEIFAIETFGTTGRGYLKDDNGIYGYGLQRGASPATLPLATAKRLYKTIQENFGTIVFCRRYLERLGVERYLAGLSCLVSHGVLEAYPPLVDTKGSYSAQFEHTILLRESNKEVISRGFDY